MGIVDAIIPWSISYLNRLIINIYNLVPIFFVVNGAMTNYYKYSINRIYSIYTKWLFSRTMFN